MKKYRVDVFRNPDWQLIVARFYLCAESRDAAETFVRSEYKEYSDASAYSCEILSVA